MATANYFDVGYTRKYDDGQCTGAVQHRRTSNPGRYHPYMGRTAHTGTTYDDVTKSTFPSQQEPMYQPGQYDRYFISPLHSYPGMSGLSTTTAGSNLAQKIMYEDMLGLYSRTREPVQSQLAPLQTLQDVCNPTVTPGTNPHCVAQTIDKNRSHPFYWRKRSEPAAGMTRTRDKYRVVYTEKQRIGLEQAYDDNKFISLKRKTELSKELDLSDRQIKIWFQNRRAKERRDSSKSEDTNSSEDDNSIKDDNDITTNAFVNPLNKFPTSCRFNETAPVTEEAAFRTGQCRFVKHGGSTSGDMTSCGTTQTGSVQDFQNVFQSRHSLSPSEWSMPINNTLPTLNVSPLAVNMDFGLLQRM